MAIRQIVQLDNGVLRKKARKVMDFDAKFQTMIDDMVETMMEAPGVGLAAPQIGVSQRVFVARLADDEESKEEYGDQAGVLYVIANPEFVKVSRKMVEGVEACLSIPGWFGDVERHEEVIVRGQDRYGKPLRVKAKGWLARVFQHEMDHLDGRLYIDLATKTWQAKDDEENASGERPNRADEPLEDDKS